MIKNKLTTAVLVLLFVAILWTIVQYMANRSGLLISPGAGVKGNQSTPAPTILSDSVPKEIKYDSSTDLKKELDSINPEVIDSDFSTLN